MFLNVFMLMKYRKSIRWNVFLAMVFPALLAAGFCTKVSLGFDVSLMKTLLGFLFIFFSVWFSFLADRIKLKPTKGLAFTAGTISGAMNGIFGAGGPPAILYLAPALEKKEEYLATAQLFFLSSNIMSFVTRVLFGSVASSDIPGIGVGVIGMFLGFHIGTKVTKRLNGVLLRRFVYIFIGINGLIIVLNQLL